jgi:hypothetical protein
MTSSDAPPTPRLQASVPLRSAVSLVQSALKQQVAGKCAGGKEFFLLSTERTFSEEVYEFYDEVNSFDARKLYLETGRDPEL